MCACIYIHVGKILGKFFVGLGCLELRGRWKSG